MAKLTTKQLATYAVDQLEKGVSASVVAKSIAASLVDSRQSRDMSRVLRAVEAELNRRGYEQVLVTSAHEATEEIKRQLAGLLGVEKPVFSTEIDPSVIGGVKASMGESEIDLTVRGRLNRFKANIINGN